MDEQPSKKNRIRRRYIWVATAIALGLIAIGIHYRGISLQLEDLPQSMAQKMETLADMRINLLKSVEAEKSAVTADTDDASVAFAGESSQATEAVEADRRKLGELIAKSPAAKELELFQEFEACWAEFRRVDRQVLDFAVQNTNLKAARLSFGKGADAMQRFEEALSPLAHDTDGRICGLVAGALAAALKIQVLHAPHIVSPHDEEMDRIEKVIRDNEGGIERSLDALGPIVPAQHQPLLHQAVDAYHEFAAVTAQVIDLSRQNTNIKSFELSLDRKRKITSQCDEILNSLQEAVRSRTFKATR